MPSNCPCCGPSCLPGPCLGNPGSPLDLILFGGTCNQCCFPLGVRIPITCCRFQNGAFETCPGLGIDTVGCAFCWTTDGCSMAAPGTGAGQVPYFAQNCQGNLYPGQSGLQLVPWPNCCAVEIPPNSGQFRNTCYPKISLMCYRLSQSQNSYILLLDCKATLAGAGGSNIQIFWTSQSVSVNPFAVNFSNSFGQTVLQNPADHACPGGPSTVPTSAVVVPHV